jgi:hypothetical protein
MPQCFADQLARAFDIRVCNVGIKHSSYNVRSGRQHVNSQAGVRHQSQGANQLCEVFELYREIVPTSKFKMEQLISEEDLRGLREDKMKSIRSLVKFLGERAA